MTRLVSYQPQYFPRLHYFARILNADVFSIADNVQFVRKHAFLKPDGSKPIGPSYQAHAPIKTKEGLMFIDVPTRHGTDPINATKLAYLTARDAKKNLRIIETHYRNAPFAPHIMPSLSTLFEGEYATLADLNIATLYWGLSELLETPIEHVEEALSKSTFRLRQIVLSSKSGVPLSDKDQGRDANDWLVDLCNQYHADEYYFGGSGADAYMDFTKFEKAGITLTQQDWRCPPYAQLHGDFIFNLSIIDLLMNVSAPEARAILRS